MGLNQRGGGGTATRSGVIAGLNNAPPTHRFHSTLPRSKLVLQARPGIRRMTPQNTFDYKVALLDATLCCSITTDMLDEKVELPTTSPHDVTCSISPYIGMRIDIVDMGTSYNIEA